MGEAMIVGVYVAIPCSLPVPARLGMRVIGFRFCSPSITLVLPSWGWKKRIK